MFRIKAHAGDNRGRELLMLLIRSGNESALCSLQSVFASADFEVKTAVFASDQRLPTVGIFVINDRDACVRERISSGRTDYDSGDSKRSVCSLGLGGWRISRRQERD